MVQNGVRVSTFSDNASASHPDAYFTYMTTPPFPTRSPRAGDRPSKQRVSPLKRRLLTQLGPALAAALIGCGPPSWPGGIHAVMASSSRGLRVVQIPVGGPAANGGLQAGDTIIAIDGQPVADLPAAKLRALLSGEVGTTVLLRVERAGTLHELPLQRAPYRGAVPRSGT
jgi:membrane-associated protease RseP (regulator of RpoE activity)